MKAVNCLQDLKAQLVNDGFEIEESEGWFLITAHGRWTMAHNEVYLNGTVIQKLSDAVVIKKPAKSKKVKVPEPVKVEVKPVVEPVKEIVEVKVEKTLTKISNKSLETKSILEKYKKIAKDKPKSKVKKA